jgi:MscS family membrane protein
MNWSTLSQTEWMQIGISILIFLATAFLGRRAIKFIIKRVARRFTRQTKTTLDDVILESVAPPLYWLVLVYAFKFSLSRLDFIFEELNVDLDAFYFVLFWLIGSTIAWRLINNLAKWYENQLSVTREIELGEQLMPFFRRLLLIILTVIVGIIFLDYFSIEVGGVVATLGIGSLAIALAAQATLSDTINGFVIMFDRPFRIGDRIELLELNTWGDVVDIGLRSTRIRTRDNRMVIVPNSVIGKSLVINHSYPDTQYRIQIEIGVAYGTDLEEARKIIVEAVRQVDGVLHSRPIEALFLEFGPSALNFRVRWWIESYIDTRRMFDKVNTAIYRELDKAGVEIPFPQQVVTYKMEHPVDAAEKAD